MFIYDAGPFQLHLCASCNCIFASGEAPQLPFPRATLMALHILSCHTGFHPLQSLWWNAFALLRDLFAEKQFSFQLNGGINVCDVAPRLYLSALPCISPVAQHIKM